MEEPRTIRLHPIPRGRFALYAFLIVPCLLLGVVAVLAADGSASVELEMPVKGKRAEAMLRRLKSLPHAQEAQEYIRLAGNLFPSSHSVHGSTEPTESGIIIRLEMVVDGLCSPRPEGFECRDLVPVRALAPALASLPERRYPLILQIPVVQHMDLHLTPPPGFGYDKPPRRITSQWGSIDETLVVEEGWLTSKLTLHLQAQTITPDEYPAFARFCTAADELMLRPLVLRRSD